MSLGQATVIPATSIAHSATTGQTATDHQTIAAAAAEADQAAMEAETVEATRVPPDLVRHNPGVAKGWAKIDQVGTLVLEASYNVASLTDTGTGQVTITWDVDFSSEDYACPSSCLESTGGVPVVCGTSGGSPAVGSILLTNRRVDTNALVDADPIFACAFGDQ